MMKPVDINPNDEWVNMVMAGITPQILMKSAYRSVMFFVGQKDLENQFQMNKVVAQCRQKCEVMQGKFSEKLEQVHTAYTKMAKKCQMMQQELESLSKDKEELQEKFSEKSRQKRKLDEMYDQLRSEFDSIKRSAIQPAQSFYPRDRSILTPDTPGQREDMWPMPRQHKSDSGPFENSAGSTGKQVHMFSDAANRRPVTRPQFVTGGSNPATALRNLLISPINRPQPTRNRPQLFKL